MRCRVLPLQMYTDREAMKRQSTVLLAGAASDTRLMNALMQIEQLNNELETTKQENKEKVCSHLSPNVHVHSFSLAITIQAYIINTVIHSTIPVHRLLLNILRAKC